MTDLLSSREEARTMPLAPFIVETMEELAADANEAGVGRAKALRAAAGPEDGAFTLQFSDAFVASRSLSQRSASPPRQLP